MAIAKKPKIVLAPLRAPEHRKFIASVFNGAPESDELKGISSFDLIANPKLGELSRRVFARLKVQFAADDIKIPGADDLVQHRLKLEGWAAVLEIMLDEVLTELESLRDTASDDLDEADEIDGPEAEKPPEKRVTH